MADFTLTVNEVQKDAESDSHAKHNQVYKLCQLLGLIRAQAPKTSSLVSLEVAIIQVQLVLFWPGLRWLWLSQHSGQSHQPQPGFGLAKLRLQLLYEKSLILAYL